MSEQINHAETHRTRPASDVASGPNKRRRVALACANCRHRKTRCDGRRPKCSLCTELGCECLYEQAGVTTSLTVGRSYLERLEKRLKKIESALGQVQDRQASETLSPAKSLINGKTGDDQDDDVRQSNVGSRESEHLEYGGIGELDTAEDSIDGMGAIKFTDEEDWGYFGPSSNIAFLRHISLALARVGDPSPALPSPSNPAGAVAGGMSVSRPHHAEEEGAGHYRGRVRDVVNIHGLPSEERTWILIKEYFQKTGQLLPFVHEESFCATYFEMKRNNFKMARRTWLGLLNIILAMATTLHVEAGMSAEERIEESDVYYQRANGLCDKESRRNISLELVQYLLVLGQYLQGTQKSVQAWTVHGLAITTAFQLGLHSPKTNKDFPPLEGEIRKRVWFGCIMLDRSLSMTFGRPSMITESYLKLELPSTTLQVLGQTPMPYPSPQKDGMFYTATLTLYNVMYKIIDTCYGQNLGLEEHQTDSEIVSLVLKGEEQLDAWRASLAPLQMSVYNTPLGPHDLETMEVENMTTERFIIVLSVRYHNLQILLHRPMLERFLNACGSAGANASNVNPAKGSGGERGMLQHLWSSSIETCINSAVVHSVVRTVVLSSGWRRDLLGAWNYSLFYTFNAGLVIFAAMQVAHDDCKKDPARVSRWKFVEDALPYFNMAVEALQNLDRGNRVVERCVSYLSQLSLGPIASSSLDDAMAQYGQHTHGRSTPAGGATQLSSARAMASMTAPSQVPIEIDLNEFMLDTDLDFFSRSFDIN
ncbi:transcriptional regulatory protein GAL4 [Emericellopsis atlantica]|uniref:Transcriptional regulatory protein GAL4 n=1 Tax=Emericellopsis atlantica TaxID=2614577 RepID=A0A9P8CMD7_9HYPO|nr:transcriptional regulatory protein GAL4 [Emericellopsis atlantica]KAG9251910.1 transcriptional regulatory protein GAL4 [Emericellopsis atlantica]